MIIKARYEITCETEDEKQQFHVASPTGEYEEGGWSVTHEHVSQDPCTHIIVRESGI